jgi:hypothetical protein
MQAAAAAGTSADLYRLRDTIEPSAKITVTTGFRITLGVTASHCNQVPVSHFDLSVPPMEKRTTTFTFRQRSMN